jgi:RNA-splicing ligase RtcB
MQTIKAKYNSANIMLPEDSIIEEETLKQIYSFLNHPSFANTYIAIMPDCHAGNGACIGFTMKLNDYIIPNIVGVDIGCGVLSYNLGNININLKSLDEFIKNEIPFGFNVNSKSKLNIEIYKDTINNISKKINSDGNRNILSLGSLGGGNHFIEVGEDEENNKWLTIHTGSRKFGLDIANFYQKKAKEFMIKIFQGASAFKNLEYLLIDSDDGKNYIKDMKLATFFAKLNRYYIAEEIIINFLYLDINELEKVESIHNYIDFSDNIIRKGAIRSYENEKLIIPFNMEDGLIIGSGKSRSKWNYSAPHGAGRLLSRTKAKANLKLDKYVESMKDKNIYTSSLNKNTLDECKDAYKDKNLIIDAIEETVVIEKFVKPIYNFKASE